MGKRHMLSSLNRYYPQADPDDWTLVTNCCTGLLQFGTEVVAADDGSITGLLGASPGASTTVTIALRILNKCYKSRMNEWNPKLVEMVPSYNPADGGYVTDEAVRGMARTARALGLNHGKT